MIRALDTNIVVRVLADRDSPQRVAAEALFTESFIIPISVFMETEWVLRSVYRWKRSAIASAFRDLLEVDRLAATPLAIDWVVDRYAAGGDFADMVHLALSGDATRFVTFDVELAQVAGESAPIEIETLLWSPG